jgi:Mat/Ecp fimbriae periplasmic chaperone
MRDKTTMTHARTSLRVGLGVAVAVLAAFSAAPARAGLVLSKVVLDMHPGRPSFDDIEIWNDGSERMYVLAEAAEILAPGKPDQLRVLRPDPSVSGLLVAPQRVVLEPGQRRTIRVSAVAVRGASDRVYRVAIKPVAGPVSAEASALKVLVGYDTLVLYRPAIPSGDLVATREGRRLTIRNQGNTAVEIFDGKQCDAAKADCRKLIATRLYAGARVEQDLPFDTPVEYQVSDGRRTISKRF